MNTPVSQVRNFQWPRLATIIALSFLCFFYFHSHGVSAVRTLMVSLGVGLFFAFLWFAESRVQTSIPRSGKTRDGFDWGMHYMRGFAIVCIMLTHFCGKTGWEQFSIGFLRSSTIYFLFISGYLCQYLAFRRPVDTGQYYLSKLKNVISPYVICSFATMAAVCLLQDKRVCVISPSAISVRALPNILLLGWAQRQYWYIPFVVILFLFSPWLTRISNRRLLWLLVVSFFAAICLPWRPPSYMTWHPIVALYRYAYFSWGYLLGFAYARWKAQIDPHLHAYVIPALLLGTLLGVQEMFPTIIPPRLVLSGSFAWTLQKLFFLVPVLWIANRIRSIRIPLFDWLATYSFTLYFLHYFFVQDYIAFVALAGKVIGPCTFLQTCAHIGLAVVFVAQNLLLALMLKKVCGHWSRQFIGA